MKPTTAREKLKEMCHLPKEYGYTNRPKSSGDKSYYFKGLKLNASEPLHTLSALW